MAARKLTGRLYTHPHPFNPGCCVWQIEPPHTLSFFLRGRRPYKHPKDARRAGRRAAERMGIKLEE